MLRKKTWEGKGKKRLEKTYCLEYCEMSYQPVFLSDSVEVVKHKSRYSDLNKYIHIELYQGFIYLLIYLFFPGTQRRRKREEQMEWADKQL